MQRKLKLQHFNFHFRWKQRKKHRTSTYQQLLQRQRSSFVIKWDLRRSKKISTNIFVISPHVKCEITTQNVYKCWKTFYVYLYRIIVLKCAQHCCIFRPSQICTEQTSEYTRQHPDDRYAKKIHENSAILKNDSGPTKRNE